MRVKLSLIILYNDKNNKKKELTKCKPEIETRLDRKELDSTISFSIISSLLWVFASCIHLTCFEDKRREENFALGLLVELPPMSFLLFFPPVKLYLKEYLQLHLFDNLTVRRLVHSVDSWKKLSASQKLFTWHYFFIYHKFIALSNNNNNNNYIFIELFIALF